jgi:sphingomyelin phosphodiesterase 4
MNFLLDAFEFFILNFAIHGTKNLHKISPAAMNVNNENTMTVYFNLVADYLCNFLPGDPNQIIFPQIDISPVKSPPPMQLPTIHPVKQPKYLLLSSLSHQQPQTPPQHNQSREMRFQQESSNWRSEAVMMLFTDCWLRMDESYELPSNEQIRVLRIMIKQMHYFGNAVEQDTSRLSVLRQQSQVILNARMYSLLKSLMARWPLDSSFLNVLELWLSYIQKWRYIFNRNIQNLNADLVEIPDKFKTFMSENLICFTQIFIQNIPRFMKMDLSVTKNAYMLFRMLKVFRQPSDILRELEKLLLNNTGRSHHSSMHDMSSSLPRSPQQHNNSSLNRSSNSIHRHQSMNSVLEESAYICMFSDEITHQIYVLMQRAFLAKLKIDQEVKKMGKQLQQNISLWERFLQFIGWLSSLNFSFSQALDEKKKALVSLDFCLNILSPMYNIPIDDVTREFEANETFAAEDSDHETMNSDFLNITPSYMKSQLSKISYTGDPQLLPIMESEVKFLVRFLYQVSNKLNEMFENELGAVWNNNGFAGRLARQILNAPVETKTFDKSQGYSELHVEHIGPRISFRKFASKKVLFALIFSFIIGRFFFGASSLGFLLFLLSCFFYLITKALIST